MAETRIYKVAQTVGDTTVIRLVDAATPAQAVRHVVRDSVRCEVCSVPDAIMLAGKGAAVEKATDDGRMVAQD